MNKNTNYEIRICSVYNNICSEWSKKEKIKTDFIDESVILNQEDRDKILNWLNPLYIGKNFYLKLIYRRENDMSVQTFHSKCDKKGPTLVVCKAGKDKIGGYTNINWESLKGINKYDDGPFIFSLNKNKKFMYTNKNRHSVFLHELHGPDFDWDFTFNYGNNMKIFFCATNSNGYSYSKEPLVGDGTKKEIIADEVEVFKVKTY